MVKTPATIITGPAVNAARAQGEQIAKLLESYRQERETAEAAEKAAAAEYTAANVDHDDGNGGTKKLCTFQAAPDGAKEAYDKCKKAEENAASTNALADAARTREKQVLDQLEALSSGLAAAVSGGTNDAGGLGSGQNRVTGNDLAGIRQTVEKIAMAPGIDEALMFCVSYLSNPPEGPAPSVIDTCNQIVAARFENDEEARGRMLNFDAAGTSISVTDYQAPASNDMATPILRAYLRAEGQTDAERVRRVELAGNVAVKLGLIQFANQITNLVYSSDAAAAAQLLGGLRLADQTEAGRPALAAQ